MPVKFDNYRDRRTAGGPLPVDPESNGFRILQFLAQRPELGFKPSEIREAVARQLGVA